MHVHTSLRQTLSDAVRHLQDSRHATPPPNRISQQCLRDMLAARSPIHAYTSDTVRPCQTSSRLMCSSISCACAHVTVRHWQTLSDIINAQSLRSCPQFESLSIVSKTRVQLVQHYCHETHAVRSCLRVCSSKLTMLSSKAMR